MMYLYELKEFCSAEAFPCCMVSNAVTRSAHVSGE